LEVGGGAARLESKVDDVVEAAVPKRLGVEAPKALNDDAARAALRKALGQEGTGKVAHHLIPLEAQQTFGDILERGRRGGFDINGANNGRLVDPADHIGGHPKYSKAVLDELGRIEDQIRAGRLSDGDVADLLQNAADTLGNAIDNGTFGPWE
jgi:hypothetical protein